MDIDIDLPTNFDPKTHFDVIYASQVVNQQLKKHPCGVYFQTMPIDRLTNLAAIPYKDAAQYGFFKIDFLHLGVLDEYAGKKEIREALRKPPNWGLLLRNDITCELFQLGNKAVEINLLKRVQPKSIQELADCIALIRPGKDNLIDAYLDDRETTRELLYRQDINTSAYAYKKGHAIAYAMVAILQLHKIEEQLKCK